MYRYAQSARGLCVALMVLCLLSADVIVNLRELNINLVADAYQCLSVSMTSFKTIQGRTKMAIQLIKLINHI